MSGVPRSWLYVPGHRPERVAKALASDAEAVVIDLEDAVPADQKRTARENALAVISKRADEDRTTGAPLWVRINPPARPEGRDDVAALSGARVDGLRIPRADDPVVIHDLADRVGLPLQLLLESARGLSRAVELAEAHELVRGIGLGEADLAADLLVDTDVGLDWARGAVVVASRAAGLGSPVQSVWTDVTDLDGLRSSSQAGRAMGFFGRSVVHPSQIAVVHEVYTPTAAQIEDARAVVRTAQEAAAQGEVAVLDDQGRFVDPAVVSRARVVLDRTPSTSPDRGEESR